MENLTFELEDVYFSYLKKFPALNGINLKISSGERIALIGANGSGKSTLLQILDGLIFPDRGKLRISGKEIEEKDFNNKNFINSFRKRVGFVFQNPDIQLFCPTVKEDILFGPLQLGLPEDEIKNNFEKIIEDFRIGNLLERSPHQLSIGEKRKVSLASVLVYSPSVLLLDEPTAGLDPRTTRELIGLLNGYHDEGKTIVTTTHDLHIIEEIASKVIVLSEEKKIVKSGSIEDVLCDEEFLKLHNLLHVHAHRHKDICHVHSHTHEEHHL